MKIERHPTPEHFWKWLKDHLPTSLRQSEFVIGYGRVQGIYPSNYRRGFTDFIFEREGPLIAEVSETRVILNYPQYFSDFEDLCRKYEDETGVEITLKYWESPKREKTA